MNQDKKKVETKTLSYHYIIAGGGIIGMTIARELLRREPKAGIAILEKESDVAQHSSGRNSGVLHAGFYYSADSLKARFTRDGNQAMRAYCTEHGLKLNDCGKIVVASSEEEIAGLEELKRRGDLNGVELTWMSEEEVSAIDPNVKTCHKALYSPTTATVDPVEVCQCMKRELQQKGVTFYFDTTYLRCVKRDDQSMQIRTSKGEYRCSYFINAAGLYADQIAHEFGFGGAYTILPFKGIYLEYAKNKSDVRTNIYPVPDLENPFLGVHFTKTVDGTVKIGPTAIPAFWRENYKGLQRFKWRELLQISFYISKLMLTNAFHFRRLAFEEMRKYHKPTFVALSRIMVHDLDVKGFGSFLQPGIRAQLLHKKSLSLVQDFVIEGDAHSMHVLNAVSPAFTCSLSFAAYVVDHIDQYCAGSS